MTKPMNLCLLGSVLLFLGMLSACAEDASQDGDGPADATGGRNPVDEALPPDAEILGSCTVHQHTCELYYYSEGSGLTETAAREQCLNIEEDVIGNKEDWSAGDGCPAEDIESACRFQNSIAFEYLGHGVSVSDRQTICGHSGGSFLVF